MVKRGVKPEPRGGPKELVRCLARGIPQKTQTSKLPDWRRSPARHFGPFVPGKDGSAQDRSRMEHRNQTRVPGVFVSYHGACRRLALL